MPSIRKTKKRLIRAKAFWWNYMLKLNPAIYEEYELINKIWNRINILMRAIRQLNQAKHRLS